MVAYVEKIVMPDGGWGVSTGVVWAWTLSAAMLCSAVIAPVAAAWADRHDAHQRALVVGTLLGVGGLLALAAVHPRISPARHPLATRGLHAGWAAASSRSRIHAPMKRPLS